MTRASVFAGRYMARERKRRGWNDQSSVPMSDGQMALAFAAYERALRRAKGRRSRWSA